MFGHRGGLRMIYPSSNNQTFVKVIFHFEYVSEDGNNVSMNENEILLLIKKTNQDWWQVIRKGDRRPFFAPAKYVIELRADDLSLRRLPFDTSFSENQRFYKAFSTFGNGKRSSYSPSSTNSSDVIPNVIFQERYKSNSLDSILVVSTPPNKESKICQIPDITKRPTFDSLDKRKSWSVIDNSSSSNRITQGPTSTTTTTMMTNAVVLGRLAAYRNTVGLTMSQSNSNKIKKPVPLPRSKIPSEPSVPPTANRLFRKSKTDLSLEHLEAYKNRRKYPAPKVPSLKELPLSVNLIEHHESHGGIEKERRRDAKSKPLEITTEPLRIKEENEDEEPEDEEEEELLVAPLSSSIDSEISKTSFESSLIDVSMPEVVTSDDNVNESPRKSSLSSSSRSPPSPTAEMTPTRQVMTEWFEYYDSESSRKFYANKCTKEKSWKPPRKSKDSNDENSTPTSPECDFVKRKLNIEFYSEEKIKVPTGYDRRQNDEGDEFFVNRFTGVRWFTAKDSLDKQYFYEENGNESCWTLPNVSQSIQDIHTDLFGTSSSTTISKKTPPTIATTPIHLSSPNFQIGSVNIIVFKQGSLNKTKFIENGRRHRKSWSSSHAVLTDTFLLFFKDAKAFGGKTMKPEHCVDLKGASVSWCDKSKRVNVFEISSTLLGLTLLIQEDDSKMAHEWFRDIMEVINKLNGVTDIKLSKTVSTKISRTKSLKLKFLGSSDELSPEEAHGNKINIREKLRKFFLRRPAMEDLFKKGIIKNEPVFGSTLKELQVVDDCDIPSFVRKCIKEIEKIHFLKTDGLYRQSGNLSTIQKIRITVDQGNLGILETVDDVHVLTGALKLFFRELKDPLIPWESVVDLLQAINRPKGQIKRIKEVLSSFHSAHKATLRYLLKHLVKVTEVKEFNRMQIPNLAIVFGPTLMWPPEHIGASADLALDMMRQNIIVETLLNNVEYIF